MNLAWFAYHREGGWLSRQFLERFGPPRTPESIITSQHEDLAFAVQELLEETALHVARTLRQRSGSPNLCLAGGVALNSDMNSRLLGEAGFERIFIQPAPRMPATLSGPPCGSGTSGSAALAARR